MSNLEAIYLGCDEQHPDVNKRYWFSVSFIADSEVYKMDLGVVESIDKDTKSSIVDDEGFPIAGCWFEPYVSELFGFVTDEIRDDDDD